MEVKVYDAQSNVISGLSNVIVPTTSVAIEYMIFYIIGNIS